MWLDVGNYGTLQIFDSSKTVHNHFPLRFRLARNALTIVTTLVFGLMPASNMQYVIAARR